MNCHSFLRSTKHFFGFDSIGFARHYNAFDEPTPISDTQCHGVDDIQFAIFTAFLSNGSPVLEAGSQTHRDYASAHTHYAPLEKRSVKAGKTAW
jgi:hypothetical protein